MSNILKALMRSGEEKLYVDDVFSTYLYTGNGTSQTITNGIDISGKGGLVWIKQRSATRNHVLFDTTRGATQKLYSNLTAAQGTDAQSLTAFTSSGFSVGSDSDSNISAGTYASWTFRKAPKFFDVVTYTGNGVSGRTIAHSLGTSPGMIIVKSTSAAGDWAVYHRGLTSAAYYVQINNTNAESLASSVWASTAPTSTEFTVGSASVVNVNGGTYVAYLFAHDTTTDGIIQCGSFTTDGSGNATVNLGWEPQFLLFKSSSVVGSNWGILDSMRGWSMGAADPTLEPNTSRVEQSDGYGNPTATGFSWAGPSASATYIYLAIRRPNKPPTTGTQVFAPVTYTSGSSPALVAGLPPDMAIRLFKTGGAANNGPIFASRLTGTEFLQSSSTNAGATDPDILFYQNGFNGGSLTTAYAGEMFKRAPGVFDYLCYSGTGSNKTESFTTLGVQPELWLVKRRNSTGSWVFGSTLLNNTEKIVMPSPNGRVTDATAWNSTYPTASALSLGTSTDVNASGGTYTAYLWASLAGVSKVVSYTGNGTTQTINCGFTTGARFVMIIRATASTAQDIFIWDSARGIVAGNDNRLSLNTTAAEVTSLDSIDTDSSGFIVNTDSSNINVNGAVYIALCYA